MENGLLFIWLTIGFSLVLFLAVPAYPHGGGLDAHGCHTTDPGLTPPNERALDSRARAISNLGGYDYFLSTGAK